MAQGNRRGDGGPVTVIDAESGQEVTMAPAVVRELALDVGSADFPEYVKRLWSGPLSVQDAVKEAEDIIKVQALLLPASIQQTKPQDWVMFGDKLYFQGTGGERINGIWGMLYGRPTDTRETFDDGTYAYIVKGPCASTRTRVVFQEIVGGRWSGEKFFRKYEKDENGEKVQLPVNPLDVLKAARTNWMINCIARVTGLRNLEPGDLDRMGFKRTHEIKGFQFDSGAKGGKGRTVTTGGAATCPAAFGPAAARGKAINDPAVTVQMLEWYMGACEKNLADASKSQYHAKDQAALKAYKDEIERRKANESAG